MRRTVNRIIKAFLPAAFVLLTTGANPQSMKTDHWSQAQLLERATHLKELAAKGDGSASETLEKYPHRATFSTALRVHARGSRKAASTRSWVST